MSIEDQRYYIRRAAQERARAAGASSPDIRRVHAALAALYAAAVSDLPTPHGGVAA